ncbi:hypothetical protein Bca101_018823 [Brassica carinata]
MDMLPKLRDRLNGKIDKTLRVSKEDKALFRHLACLFNGAEIDYIKRVLADSDLNVDAGLKNLLDKSLIHVRGHTVGMHCLVQEMGKEVVRSQSNEPGERVFLLDSKDVCDVLEDNTGTKKVLGISLDMSGIDELHIHKRAFEKMRNLYFLKVKQKRHKEVQWHIHKDFNYLPPKLKVVSWKGYPLRCLPYNFCPQHLVKLKVPNSNLKKLWDGVHPLTCLKRMDLSGSKNLKEIPDLSLANNLEKLLLTGCSSLMAITSSIGNLHKHEESQNSYDERNQESETMGRTTDLSGSEKLQEVPDLSLAINMEWMNLGGCSSLVELPSSSIQNLKKLAYLSMEDCTNLEVLPTDVNLESLDCLNFGGCSRLKMFPEISNTMYLLILNRPAIEEVPRWIDTFNRLRCLRMKECKNLKRVPPFRPMRQLKEMDFSGWGDIHMNMTTATENMKTGFPLKGRTFQVAGISMNMTTATENMKTAPAPVEKADDDEEAKEEGYDENQKFDDLERNDTGLFANDVYDEDDKEADAIWESIDQMMDSSRHHGRKLSFRANCCGS